MPAVLSEPVRSHFPTTVNTSTAGRPDFISIQNFSFFYGAKQALFDISMDIPERQVTAFIGPSGCGKSTLLRNLNRMNELIDGISHTGDIIIHGHSIYDPLIEVISLRKRVGMVFQKSNPFPKTIYENVVYPLRVAGQNAKSVLDETVERSLKGAALWDEVKDRLNESAYSLSGGQQQRAFIAKAIAAGKLQAGAAIDAASLVASGILRRSLDGVRLLPLVEAGCGALPSCIGVEGQHDLARVPLEQPDVLLGERRSTGGDRTRYTGAVGSPRQKQEMMSVPPEIEAR